MNERMRKTVLLVDDSGSSRDLTSHFLQEGGFRVLEAEDGQAALELLKKRRVDLILTDIMMPNMDGWAFYKEVRKDKRYNLTPFVFLSVLDELDDQIKGLQLGVDDYLTKPITPAQLLARVNTALMRSERLARYFHRNPVTELETAEYMRARIVQEAERCRKRERPVSLVVFGIGNFVALVRGQAEWFAVQAAEEAGMRIRKAARSYDVVADMGAGRFAALMPEADVERARAWAEQLRAAWDLKLLWEETEQRIPVDIGFTVDAVSPGEGDPLALLDARLASFERKW
ncbi:MAG: response regulator [Mariprofundaceae bacterium]